MESHAALLEKLPAQDPASAEPILRRLVQGGRAAITQVIGQVGEQFGDPAGVKATYALHGATHYACRPGADADRKMMAETLAAALAARHSADLKSLLCQQLQLCGGGEQAPALAGLLGDEALCEPATQALVAIASAAAANLPPVAAALRGALPKAQGKARVTIVTALGRLGDRGAADEIRKSADAPDPELRRAAWYALGNIGDPASAPGLLKAAGGEPSFERTQATDACLRLARRLGQRGRTAEAEAVLRPLLAQRKGADDVHDRLAALECLAKVSPQGAMPELTAALASEDLRCRAAAARIALELARAIQKTEPEQSARLLKKILEATEEQAVRGQAERLLGKQAK